MQPSDSSIISIPGSPKTWNWKQSPTLPPQITEKSQKGLQTDSQETPQMDPKIDKIDSWTSRCLVGVPLESWITKIVNLVTKMEPQGLQNHDL